MRAEYAPIGPGMEAPPPQAYAVCDETDRGSTLRTSAPPAIFLDEVVLNCRCVLFHRDAEHKPTLCVWELVPVQHEQQAWTRFLASARRRGRAGLDGGSLRGAGVKTMIKAQRQCDE